MSKKRVLLMYISENSGHHRASVSIENALKKLSDDIETVSINSFCYTNPILERIVNSTYMSVIKRKPEFWGYLYDNPGIVKKTQRLKDSIHRYNSQKMKNLIDKVDPDAVICTQAFPCGIMADFKKTYGYDTLLAGVLTDYAPHSYWLYDAVDMYFVPSEEARERLMINGIADSRITLSGIPIDPKFTMVNDKGKIRESFSLAADDPVILVMGGSQGLGPIRDIIRTLDNIKNNFQIVAVAGTNKKLYRYLSRLSGRLKKRLIVISYTDRIDELMDVSSAIITKPGGITISESLSKGLPILIVRPIPGQEALNTEHLVKHKVGIKIQAMSDLETVVSELLSNRDALFSMQQRAKESAKPDSAFKVAHAILERIM